MLRSLIDRRISALLSVLLGLALMTLLVAPAQPQSTPKRLPIPTGESLTKSEELIESVFGEDFKKASKDPAFASALAEKWLLKQAREMKQKPAYSYVLYCAARDLAAGAGDLPLLLAIVDDMTRDFALDPLETKTAALDKAASATTTPENYKALLETALTLSKEAAELDLYDTAVRLGNVADKAARKLKDVPLILSVGKANEGIAAQQKAFGSVKKYADKLKKDPSDPEANLEMGKYLCLFRNQWDRGLPLLAKGSDAQLKKLAQQDLAKPKDDAGQVKVGDDWWDYAETAKVPVQTNVRLRALYWFEQAMPQLKGLTRTRLTKRIDDVAAAGAPQKPVIGPVGPVGQIRVFQGHTNSVNGVAFSPDGQSILSGSTDETMRLWSAKDGKVLQVFKGHSKMVWSVAFSPRRPQVFSGCWDGTVRMFDLKTGNELKRYPSDKDVNGIAVSRDGKYLLSGSDDQSMRLWDVDKGEMLHRFQGHSNFVYGVAFSPDGKRALSASADGTVRYWDLIKREELRQWTNSSGATYHVAFTEDGLKGTFSGGDPVVQLVELGTGKVVQKFNNNSPVKTVAIHGRRLLTGDANGAVKLWDLTTGKELHNFAGHNGAVVCVAFSPDGARAVSGGDDNTVRLWQLPR
jgi:hypothetical protein